jgi:signal transduction histidine kinase
MTISYPNVFFFSSLSLFLTSLFLIILIFRFKKTNAQTLWLFFNFSVFVWGLGATLTSMNSNSPNLAVLSWRIGCIGASYLSVSFSHFIFSLINYKNKKFLIFSYVFVACSCLLILFSPLIMRTPIHLFQNNFFLVSAGTLYPLWFITWFASLSYAHFILIRYCIMKKELKICYLELAILPAFIIGSLNFLNPYSLSIFQYANFGITLYCIAVTYLIFSNQIVGIKIVFKKSLFYSLLISVLTGLYLLLIICVEWTLKGWMGYKSIIVSLISAFFIALLFNPIKDKIQEFVDKIFLGKTPKEMANENELLRQQLERSERLKTASTLALGLAHEVKNPLTTIKTFAEYLPEKYQDREFVEKFSKIIPDEVERINSIIKQLLDFSKPSPPSFIKTNVSQLIRDTLEFLNSEFLKRKVKIDLTDNTHSQTLTIDPNQIKQAILNIIFNSMEAMRNGGSLDIMTGLIKEDYLEIKISDSGCGMSKEDQKHIFDPFFSTKDSGTGLGLSIAHQIIRNHGGSIEVESEREKGTSFLIKLPIRNDESN